MTAPSTEPHTAALVALLTAELPGLVGVGLAEAPERPYPYVVLIPDPGNVYQTRLCDERSTMRLRFAVTAMGSGPEQALWVADRARQVLLGPPPAVPGRLLHRMWQVGGEPIERDSTVQPPVFGVITEYQLLSQPG